MKNDAIYEDARAESDYWLVAVKFSVAEVAYTQASPSSSSEKVECSESDVDYNNMHPALHSSKFSYFAAEEMEVLSIVWLEKCEAKFLLVSKKITKDQNPITKEERIFESPLCLRLSFLCDDGE